MKKLLFLLLLTGCNSTSLNTVSKDDSVRWNNDFQETPPNCVNTSLQVEGDGIFTCYWDCKNFWTPLRGSGRYNVARTWRWHELNRQWQMTTLGTDPQWHEACDPLEVTE